MNVRRAVGTLLILFGLVLATAVPAMAGGWAVITLDSLPQGVAPGAAFNIGFTVRQHGRTPLSHLDPAPLVQARNESTGEVVQVTASDDGLPGHYSAEIVLPSRGKWRWGIQAFGPGPQPMPPIVVAGGGASAIAAATVPTLFSAATSGEPASAVPAILAAVLAAAGIALAVRRRFLASGIAILIAALAAGMWIGAAAPSTAVAEAASPQGMDERGAALFLAKGCVVCHVNQDLPESEGVSISIGPDLTRYSNDPAFLAKWLANPAAVRPAAEMPDLGLSAAEIEALIAFLNADTDV
jgi:cytochrome c2